MACGCGGSKTAEQQAEKRKAREARLVSQGRTTSPGMPSTWNGPRLRRDTGSQAE